MYFALSLSCWVGPSGLVLLFYNPLTGLWGIHLGCQCLNPSSEPDGCRPITWTRPVPHLTLLYLLMSDTRQLIWNFDICVQGPWGRRGMCTSFSNFFGLFCIFFGKKILLKRWKHSSRRPPSGCRGGQFSYFPDFSFITAINYFNLCWSWPPVGIQSIVNTFPLFNSSEGVKSDPSEVAANRTWSRDWRASGQKWPVINELVFVAFILPPSLSSELTHENTTSALRPGGAFDWNLLIEDDFVRIGNHGRQTWT